MSVLNPTKFHTTPEHARSRFHLSVAVWRGGVWAGLALFAAVLAGLLDRGGDFPDRTDSLEIHQARQVRVDADPPMEVQYDGEATRLMTPFSARILPGAARFVVSEECLELFGEA